ncbi:AAA family ATPase [Kordia sp.]|uniref:AAA family ATPase n=1 Tax=Kordia sp. TaxID=1965332 RepID=UPI003D6B15AE
MECTYDIFLEKNENSNLNNYFTSDDLEEPIKHLKNFNKINIFVGANNSGKSRFMRELMAYSSLNGINKLELVEWVLSEYNKLLLNFDFIISLKSNIYSQLQNILKYESSELEYKENEELKLFKLHSKSTIQNLNSSKNILEKIKFIFENKEVGEHSGLDIMSFFPEYNRRTRNYQYFSKREEFLEKIGNYQSLLSNLFEKRITVSGKKIYIPTLRTAHSLFIQKENNSRDFKKIRDDIFLDTTRKNYEELNIISHEQRKSLEDKRLQKENTNTEIGNIDVFTGMNLYNEIVNVRNSKKEKRDRFLEFEEFLKTYFFDGKTIDIVAEFNMYRKDAEIENDDEIQVFIGDKSEKLYNLGDGVQALIILMYKIFLADNDSVIYIDEPEINLHPGYQRLFLEQITNNKELTNKNLTYVIVTHSNHFLDLTLEKDNVSIYSFSALPKEENEEGKFMIRNVNAGDNQLLRDLGVNNSSVFLANSSVWVEGISDRNFIKAFLIAYCEASEDRMLPREDIDYAFFKYAGSNLTHYDFRGNTSEGKEIKLLINSYALNNRIFLLSDLDDGKDAKHKTLEEVADDNENFVFKTTKPYREIENLLPNEIWGKVLIEFRNQIKVKGEESIGKFQKKINRSLAKVESEKYSEDYIGNFLNALKLTQLNKIWEEDSKGNPKTFKQKAKLSEIVLRKVRAKEITWEDFSKNKTIVELTKSIYNFIKNT